MDRSAEELGLFPLGIVLLPREHVPLHIFEPRYRELIGECLDSSSEFGLIYYHDETLGPIGTRAAVDEVLQRYEDGRLDIVVTGGRRFRLLELTSGRSFITAHVGAFDDTDDPATPQELAACHEAFDRVLLLAGARRPGPDPDSFAMAASLGLPNDLKQELLGMPSERDRILRLTAELSGPLATELEAREIGRRASTNGKVDHL